MHYLYTKKNNLLLSFLLFLSCVQPIYTSQTPLFLHNLLNSELYKNNKTYIVGVGSVALLCGVLYCYFKSNNRPSNSKPVKNNPIVPVQDPIVPVQEKISDDNVKFFVQNKAPTQNPIKQIYTQGQSAQINKFDPSKINEYKSSAPIEQIILTEQKFKDTEKKEPENKIFPLDQYSSEDEQEGLKADPQESIIIDEKLVDDPSQSDDSGMGSGDEDEQGHEKTDEEINEQKDHATNLNDDTNVTGSSFVNNPGAKPTDIKFPSLTPPNNQTTDRENGSEKQEPKKIVLRFEKLDSKEINNTSTKILGVLNCVSKNLAIQNPSSGQSSKDDNTASKQTSNLEFKFTADPKKTPVTGFSFVSSFTSQNIDDEGDDSEKQEPEIIIQNKFDEEDGPFTTYAEIQKKVKSSSDTECNKLTDILIKNFNDAVSPGWLQIKKESFFALACCPENFLQNNGNQKLIKIRMAKQALGAYVFCNAEVLNFIDDFLQYKYIYGTEVEKEFYERKKFTPFTFIQRVVSCRPIVFVNANDAAILDKNDLDDAHCYFGTAKKNAKGQSLFDNLSTDKENIEKYITYDEMLISTLMGYHTNTFTINQGHRKNCGLKGDVGEYENKEVGVTNVVGVRLERSSTIKGDPGLMGYRFFIVDPYQNTCENGYGFVKSEIADHKKAVAFITLFQKLYKVQFPTYQEVEERIKDNDSSFIPLVNIKDSDDKEVVYFHVEAYKIYMNMILLDYFTNHYYKYKDTDTKVYESLVGLGTGEWATIKMNNKTFAPRNMSAATFLASYQITLYMKILDEYAPYLKNIHDIDLAFFGYKIKDGKTDTEYTNKQYDIFEKLILSGNTKFVKKDNDECYRLYEKTIKGKIFRIHLSQRPPFKKLPPFYDNFAIEVMTPGDCNSFFGNEFWTLIGRGNTGESAMACATLGATYLNPGINEQFINNIVALAKLLKS